MIPTEESPIAEKIAEMLRDSNSSSQVNIALGGSLGWLAAVVILFLSIALASLFMSYHAYQTAETNRIYIQNSREQAAEERGRQE